MILGLTDTMMKLRTTLTPNVRNRLALLTTAMHIGTLLPFGTEDGEPEDVEMKYLHSLIEETCEGNQAMAIAYAGHLCLSEKIRS
jgi:hypothetical protein